MGMQPSPSHNPKLETRHAAKVCLLR